MKKRTKAGHTPSFLRIAESQGKPVARIEAAVQSVGPVEDDGQRVDQRPHIAHQRGYVGDAHPPEDPDHGGRKVFDWRLIAQSARRHGEQEQRDGGRLDGQQRYGMRQQTYRPELKQIEGGVVAVSASFQEVPDGCKREGDGHSRAADVQVERDGQIVALPEAVSVSRLQE